MGWCLKKFAYLVKCRLRSEHPEIIFDAQRIAACNIDAHLQNGCYMPKFCYPILRVWRSCKKLARYGPVPGMRNEGLLWRQTDSTDR